MRIGILRPYEVEFNPGDILDLKNAIERRGHRPVDIYIDALEVQIETGSVRVSHAVGREVPQDVRVPGAILRHLGISRDFEQHLYRVWAARALEVCGVYVMNPVTRWLIAGDKMAALIELSRAGLPVPPTVVTENMFAGYRAVSKFRRAVIKQLRGAMGYGVFLVDDPDVAFHIFSMFANINKPIYVQKFLEKGAGDYRVVVVGGRALGAVYRRAAIWKTNVAQGAVPEPARLTPQLEELATRAVEVLGLDYGGVDIAETRDGYYILEVNPTMSWQGFKAATGINPADHIMDYLLEKLRK